MLNRPDLAPFAPMLADAAAALRRGTSCLVVADKGWTPFLYHDLRDRLVPAEVRCVYLNGRALAAHPRDEHGVMLATVGQFREAVRGPVEKTVLALPHLDVMTALDGGWTSISRETVPLLYENPDAVWLGFRDPTLPLLSVVEKLFFRQFIAEVSFRDGVGGDADISGGTGGTPVSEAPDDRRPAGPTNTPAPETGLN